MVMKTSRNFVIIDKELIKEFRGEYNLLMQLYLYIEAYNMYETNGKLQTDGSFFISDQTTADKLGMTRKTVWKNKKELEKRGFLEIEIKEAGGASYLTLNTQRIEDIQNRRGEYLKFGDVVGSQQKAVEQPVIEETTAPEPITLPTPLEPKKEEYENRIKEAWNRIAEINGLPKILMLKEERIKKFKNVIKYLNMTEKEFFNAINSSLKESKFLRGYGQKWRADFDFFLSKQKALKTLEGGYRDNKNELMEKLQDVQTMTYKEASDIREKMLSEKYRQMDKERRAIKQEAKIALPK